MQIDKQALVMSGKYFGRIFLAYLFCCQDYQDSVGKYALAHKLLTKGQTHRGAKVSALSVGSLCAMAQGKRRMAHWLNYSSMMLAIEHQFFPEHPADSLGLVATLISDYKSQNSSIHDLTFGELTNFIKQNTNIEIPEEHYSAIEEFLAKKHRVILIRK